MIPSIVDIDLVLIRTFLWPLYILAFVCGAYFLVRWLTE